MNVLKGLLLFPVQLSDPTVDETVLDILYVHG